jgi:hypothetical protein
MLWAVYMSGLVVFALWNPLMWLVVVGVIALQFHLHRSETQQWQRRAAARANEDIGTFARAFTRGPEPFDPRVIRAVWDALAVEVTPGGPRVPVRPGDKLEEDFEIEDVEPLATGVAERAGRSAMAWQAHPGILADVVTVRDLVRLTSGQPPRAPAV